MPNRKCYGLVSSKLLEGKDPQTCSNVNLRNNKRINLNEHFSCAYTEVEIS